MALAVSIFGLGYVGTVTAACLTHKGHSVIGVDPSATKVAAINSGRSPIVEDQVEELISAARKGGRISATTDANAAVTESQISFISVGTPNLRNGKLDLSHVQNVCREIGDALRRKKDFHWIVLRSTVLPGTTDAIVIPALEVASGKRAGRDFAVCFNPEFLREGSAVSDFFAPPFTILGSDDRSLLDPVEELYAWAASTVFKTSFRTAEMVKYACNAFHALKVTFANEVGTICGRMDVDPKAVMDIFKMDTRLNISTAYLNPGFAFGGSCLPKDLRALTYKAKELDLRLPLLESILPSNTEHVDRAIETVLSTGKKRVGVLGLSFKAGTDDLRESPMVHLVKRLLGEGCHIAIWDEDVSLGRLIGSNRQFIEGVIPHIGQLLCPNMIEVLEQSEIVISGTSAVKIEELIANLQNEAVVIDLQRLGQPVTVHHVGSDEELDSEGFNKDSDQIGVESSDYKIS